MNLAKKECQNLKAIDFPSDIYVSTDSQEYLDHINDLIENAPTLRPKNISGDLTGDIEVLTHAFHTQKNTIRKTINVSL